MNVKANLALLELPEVEEHVRVSLLRRRIEQHRRGLLRWRRSAGKRIEPLGAIYYGEPITDGEAEQALKRCVAARAAALRLDPGYREKSGARAGPGQDRRAGEGRGRVRSAGAGKPVDIWRARILPAAVRTINQIIKNRDFWMPFAPSVLAERAARYYDKPKPVDSPYMMFAFRTRPERRAALAGSAASLRFHYSSARGSVAAQPRLFTGCCKSTKSITGEAAVLNTSFNLHGEPIVYRARDAVDVFLRSGLEHMALGNWWVEKTA